MSEHEFESTPSDPTEVDFMNEVQGVPFTKEEVEDQIIKAANEAKEAARKKKALLISLRRHDDVGNRTCAECLRRLPIEKFPRYKRSEFCEDCD